MLYKSLIDGVLRPIYGNEYNHLSIHINEFLFLLYFKRIDDVQTEFYFLTSNGYFVRYKKDSSWHPELDSGKYLTEFEYGIECQMEKML